MKKPLIRKKTKTKKQSDLNFAKEREREHLEKPKASFRSPVYGKMIKNRTVSSQPKHQVNTA